MRSSVRLEGRRLVNPGGGGYTALRMWISSRFPPPVWRALAVLSWAAVIAASACGRPPDYDAALAEAKQAFQAGSYERAYELFDQLRREHPDRQEPSSYLARTASRLGRPEQAIPALEQRIARGGPGLHVYHDLLARLLEEADRWEEAEAQYRQALRLEPGYAPSCLKLSQLLARFGEYDEALELAGDGASRSPDDVRLRSWYGNVLLKRHRWREAEQELRQALALPGAGAYPHYLLGLTYLNTSRPEAARDELAKATQLEPRAYDAWYQLAHASEQVGDLEARDRALEQFAVAFRRRYGEPVQTPSAGPDAR